MDDLTHALSVAAWWALFAALALLALGGLLGLGAP